MKTNLSLPVVFDKESELHDRNSSSFPGASEKWTTGLTIMNSAFSGFYRKQTDDLTFIIPYATDVPDRRPHLAKILTWILMTTSAKVIITSAETEQSIKNFDAPMWIPGNVALPSTLLHHKLEWDEYKKAAEFGDFEKIQMWFREIIYHEICMNVFSSSNLGDKFGLSFHLNRFGPDISHEETDPGVIVRDALMDRVTIVPMPREHDEAFHRTKYLNLMTAITKTPFVCNHDCDILISSFALMTALGYLRGETADVVYPYARDFSSQKRVFRWNGMLPWEPIPTAILTGDLVPLVDDCYSVLPWMAAYGHSILFNKEKYISIGAENEEFISWGAEDLERYHRAVKMGLTVARVDGPVVHFEHARNQNSSDRNPHFKHNEDLWTKLRSMNKKELDAYYENIPYKNQYGW